MPYVISLSFAVIVIYSANIHIFFQIITLQTLIAVANI